MQRLIFGKQLLLFFLNSSEAQIGVQIKNILMQKLLLFIVILCGALMSSEAVALVFHLPPPSESLVGEIRTIKVGWGETVEDICTKYNIGYYELAAANPMRDFKEGTYFKWELTIPTQYILPSGTREGIVINLSEFRLYYYPKNRPIVMTFPIGIGRKGETTPLIKTVVRDKKYMPEWIPTQKARAKMLKEGIFLPKIIGAGPENPLGKFYMRLGGTTFLLHSTNRPLDVGKRMTSGCISMLPEDMEQLFPLVPLNTPIRVVSEPVKIGWYENDLYLESHAPIDLHFETAQQILSILNKLITPEVNRYHAKINWIKALEALRRQDGVPALIGHRSSDAVELDAEEMKIKKIKTKIKKA